MDKLNKNIFKGCNNLKKVFISTESEINTIDSDVFNNCEKLEYIQLPKAVKRIEFRSFYRTKSLKKIALPEDLEYIGKEAFYLSGIENIEIPDKVKEIDDFAFKNCKYTTNIKIPKSVKRIGNAAFSGCRRLKTIEISYDLENIGDKVVNLHTIVKCKEGSNVDNYCEKFGIKTEYI